MYEMETILEFTIIYITSCYVDNLNNIIYRNNEEVKCLRFLSAHDDIDDKLSRLIFRSTKFYVIQE